LRNTAVILAGGSSSRFGQDKGLIKLGDKSIILHIIEAVVDEVDEIVLVVNTLEKRKRMERELNFRAKIVIDDFKSKSPLIGALTGFRNAKGKFSLLLPCDTPFISTDIISALLDSCVEVNAVIPKWPKGFIEPLQAAYRTDKSVKAIEKTLRFDRYDFRSFIAILGNVRYILTSTLQEMDPELLTFININTVDDLRKAEIKRRELSDITTESKRNHVRSSKIE